MKKTLFSIAFMALMLIIASGYKSNGIGTHIGDLIPDIELKNSQNHLDISNLRGKYVLLTFWTSADAASRVECNKYSAWFEENNPSKVAHVSVNFDKDYALFQEVIANDGLKASTQYNVTGSQADKLISEFRLNKGYGSILIAPNGTIAKYNPSTSELISL